MKLSNKILLGFIGFAFVYLNAAFTELRLTGIPNVINDNNSKAETVDLSAIQYIVVEDVGRHVNITGADRLQLEVRSLTGDALQHLKYRVNGDTLTLLRFGSEDMRTIRISVRVPEESINGIEVKSSIANVSGLQQSRLRISVDKGRVWLRNSQISALDMGLANHSYFELESTDIDSLSADIDRSEAYINAPTKLVRANVVNRSALRLSQTKELRLTRDDDSNVNLY
jgi:hypothetical protein